MCVGSYSAVLLFPLCVFADVRLPHILSNSMVVQRNLPVHVWGMAGPAEEVAVSFRGETKSTAADALGRWSVYLRPGEAGGPFELTVVGRNRITLRDILAGDVWIASGQSNMEWPVGWSADPERERAAANLPNVRLARTMHRVSDYPLDGWIGQQWASCSPASVEHFSAVAYHFGRNLHERLKVPIGLIQTAWGGTPIEAWTSMRGLSSEPALMPVFQEWARMTETHATALLRHPQVLADWKLAAARAKAEGLQAPEQPALRRGPGGPWQPAGLFNAMIAPLTEFAIRGVIWYQGEANTATERAPWYRHALPALIRDWRRAWGIGDFPFLFVQLANYDAAPDSMWPEVREAQRESLSVTNTGMAVTIDIGEPGDIHPRNKRDVGRRLALVARAMVYGDSITYSGPLMRQVTVEGAAARIWFDHVGSGLVARDTNGTLHGFEVRSREGRYLPAEARIDGRTVLISSPEVPVPARVRYSWADNPKGNLFNAEGLPASPFRWE